MNAIAMLKWKVVHSLTIPVPVLTEDVGEWELVDDNADNMDGGVLETDDANYDDQDGKEYTHDTGLIDANVMDNDKSEDNELPARFKECYF